MEFFLDFETMNSNFGSIIVDNNSVDYENFNFIFMIGVGFENKNKEWEFKSFIAEEKTLKNEKFMFNKFWLYINQKLKQYKKKTPIFVHWSPAEKTAYNKLKQRNMDLPDINLLDLYQVFLDEPIVIKGALSYSLKAITKALYNNKLINTIWDGKNQCANGLNAMLLAFDIYSKFKKVTNKITSIREIEQYNEIDCKCLWEIINYLRKNH
jgi:predicted RecB family nuclease